MWTAATATKIRILRKKNLTPNQVDTSISGSENVTLQQHIGNVYNQSPSDQPNQPYSPPPLPPEKFTGRTEELQDIHQQLQKSDRLLLMSGIGGIGKTTLAMKYCDQYKNDYDYILWFFCDKGIAEGISENRNLIESLRFPNMPTATPKQKLEKIIPILANLKGKHLMVIDNANDSQDISHTSLQIDNWKILLTTRADLSKNSRFHTKKIDVLSPELAAELFYRYFPDAKKQLDLLQRLLIAVGNHTLVIELMAKTLDLGKERAYDLTKLCADLENNNILTLPNTPNITPEYFQLRNEKLQPTEILQRMYDWAALSDSENHILQYFAVLPADFIPFLDVAFLFQIEESLQLPFQEQLRRLCKKGWLEHSDLGYKLHQVLQTVIRQAHPPTCQRYEDLLNHLYLTFEQQTITQTHHLLPYAHHLIFQLKEVDGRLRSLCYQVCDACLENGSLLKGLAAAEKFEGVCEELGEEENLMVAYERQGIIYLSLGSLDKALNYFELCSKIGKELHEANLQSERLKNGLAISYSKLGKNYQALRNFDKALHYYELRLKIGKELYESNLQSETLKRGLAVSYEKLGKLHQALGNLDKTLNYLLGFLI